MSKLFNAINVAFLAWVMVSFVQVLLLNTTTATYPDWNFFIVLFGGAM